MLNCPHCNKQLKRKVIHTVGAGRIDVDYCPACGGIFFDQGEVNRITAKNAEELVQNAKDYKPHIYQNDHTCPRCGASLRRFFGESVPDDVHILRCPDCSGTWFEADELTRFKKAQNTKLNYYRTWKLPLSSLSKVLIPIALFITLTSVTLITVDQVQQETYTSIQAQEIITEPVVIVGEDNTSITILFTTSEPARTELVFYHDKPIGKMTVPISNSLSKVHQVEVLNVSPGRPYQYQINIVTAESSFTSELFEFRF